MTDLCCPSCGSNDQLGSVERLEGIGRITAVDAATREIVWEGTTDMDWDGSTTVGAQCQNCGWGLLNDDAPTGNAFDELIDPHTGKPVGPPPPPPVPPVAPPKFASVEEADAWLDAHAAS